MAFLMKEDMNLRNTSDHVILRSPATKNLTIFRRTPIHVILRSPVTKNLTSCLSVPFLDSSLRSE